MTTPASLNSFLKWLQGEIESAKEDVQGNKAYSPNTYGAGYDAGFLAGLQSVHQYYTGDDE